MKGLLKNIVCIILLSRIVFACSEEEIVVSGNKTAEGQPVELKLSYEDVAPTVVKTRATDAEERQLNNLQIFVFSSEGKLKGYKMVEDGLAQNGAKGRISIKTTTGESYIYAIANYKTGVYSVELPEDLDEEKAQAGEINFSLQSFQEKAFTRVKGQLVIADGTFLMSGSANDGKLCTISKSGESGYISSPTQEGDKLIKLRRVVSKIQFDFKAASGKTFTPIKYDIVNVPLQGSIVKGKSVTTSYEKIENNLFTTQSPNQFIVYLPENMQVKRNDVKDWNQREANTYSGDVKTFTNAPENGTYVIVYGKYTDDANKIEADVNYTIHLGDFSKDYNNYDNERNYRYYYNVTIEGVDKIIAEAKKEGDEQPGAEGLVIQYNTGKPFTLDSHYETCVMRFKQSDIQELKKNGKGYIFQVQTFGNQTEPIIITGDTLKWDDERMKGVDMDWVQFAQGGTYNEKDSRGGTPRGYASTKGEKLLTIQALLQHLYTIADQDRQWNKGTLDYTCYVKENYYEDRGWSQYVNIDPRVIYIANDVKVSEDGKSIYATIAYGVSQYAIQTFYDRRFDNSLIAYGCETINDEEGKSGLNRADVGANGDIRDDWNGRTNMKADISYSTGKKWESLRYNNLYEACMSRNRDLNRNGKIDEDEIRWYTASLPQYTGLWIGEEALSTNARLYTKDTKNLKDATAGEGWVTGDIMHYYTSTKGKRTFWSEEGAAFGNLNDAGNTKYVRCIRTLKSREKGVTDTPHKYYSYKDNVFSMENKVDESALRTSTINTDLGSHHERNELNRARVEFRLASKRAGQNYSKDDGRWDWSGNASKYTLSVIKESRSRNTPCYSYGQEKSNKGSAPADQHTWRSPNQREFALIVLEGQAGGSDACRTGFSGTHRFGYQYSGGNLMMLKYDLVYDGNKNEKKSFQIRCVRDY